MSRHRSASRVALAAFALLLGVGTVHAKSDESLAKQTQNPRRRS